MSRFDKPRSPCTAEHLRGRRSRRGSIDDDALWEWAESGWRAPLSPSWWAVELTWLTFASATVVVAVTTVPALVGPWIVLLLTALAVQVAMIASGRSR